MEHKPPSPVGQAMTRSRPVSDHFDGKRFYNPTLPERFDFRLSMIFRMLRERTGRWPASVENTGVPRLHETLAPDEVALTFINHATFLIQIGGLNILTDPIWSKRAGPFSWLGPARVRKPGVELDALPHIDLVLISHNHYDHFDAETLGKLHVRFAPTVIVAVGDEKLAAETGLQNVYGLDWWEEFPIGEDMKITFSPTQHSSARSLFDRDRSLWGSFMIHAGNRRVYFGGDAAYSTHYAEIQRRLGAPDIALLGIGAYEPRWFMKPMHMNPSEAVQAHLDLGSRQSIGMHFGTFRLSGASEPINQPQADLDSALLEAGVSPADFVTLREGETRIYGCSNGCVSALATDCS